MDQVTDSVPLRLEPGDNPRNVLPNHRERGPRKFTYTLRDVAALFGVSTRTLRRWRIADPERVDPSNLAKVCELYARRISSGVL